MRIFLLVLALTGVVFSQTFEEYEKQRKAEFEAHVAKEKAEFRIWQNLQDKQLRQWQKEERQYLNNNLFKFSISKSANSIAKSNNDYGKNTVNVTAIGSGKTKTEAVQKALDAVAGQLKKAVTEIDGNTAKISAAALNSFSDVRDIKKKAKVKKSGDAYIAEVSTSKDVGEVVAAAVPRRGRVRYREYKGSYTGVIINAKGLSYKACLIPVVVDDNGKQLYGPKHVDKEKAINGMVVWRRSLDKAKMDKKTGKNPLIVRATKVVKKRRLVVAGKDKKKLESMAGSSILRSCKVTIIVD